ncbi:MAG: type II toxin-antitoxin system Phd/YefM family antitoxin [candidate division NC10 bacterium]
MPMIDRFVPITQAKNRLLDLAREVEREDGVVAITRNGVPAAILLSPAKFEGLLETLEILSDARTMRALHRSLGQAAAGKWVSESRVFGRE